MAARLRRMDNECCPPRARGGPAKSRTWVISAVRRLTPYDRELAADNKFRVLDGGEWVHYYRRFFTNAIQAIPSGE
ncbi:hypothetical protein MSIM_39580 [Mycobacterium simiae]|nr:hypothetical protein MSIM_39580 [Mycobacterium simiae]